MTEKEHASTEIAIDPADSFPGPNGCVLHVAEGSTEDRGKYVTLSSGSVVLGTADDCDIQLNDRQVSNRHAELRVVDKGIELRDLGSTNGTFYLGNRIDKGMLVIGARLRVGKTIIALLPISDRDDAEPTDVTHYGHLIGGSLVMRRLFTVMQQLETGEPPVLIRGETGTGKELVARTLHSRGKRRNRPFVVLDCGAIPPELIDSELFGHAKGAFTGAINDRAGVFEQANGGTLFIDEIGELPLEQQPRLLRVLETGEVRRVGANKHETFDVRVVAATHRDLKSAVDAGTFREDLYYRMAVVRLTVPPLRDRPEDIPELAQHLAGEIGGDETEPLPNDVLNLMTGYDWPGNVRELRNAVHQLLSLGRLPEEATQPEGSPTAAGVDTSRPYKQARADVVGRFEAAYVKSILDQHDGNISGAARAAGVDRGHFKDLMRKHGLYDS